MREVGGDPFYEITIGRPAKLAEIVSICRSLEV
jgi:hypothetical protein